MKIVKRVVACLVLSTLCSAPAYAVFPERTVKILVGFAPGGGTDVLARIVAAKLSERWKLSVIVENKPGADGTIAEDVLVHSPPDGYTLMMINNNHVVTPSQQTLTYDPIKDVAPITIVASGPDVLLVNPDYHDVRSLSELIALAKSQPGKLSYGTTGVGGPPFLEMELLKKAANFDIVPVPYKGAGPALLALLGGEIDTMLGSIQDAKEHIKAGRLRALATSRSKRSPALPDVPTIAEATGIADFDGGGSWYGLAGPGKLPSSIVATIHDAVVESIQADDVAKKLADMGFERVGNSSNEFADFIAKDIPKWHSVLDSVGYQRSP